LALQVMASLVCLSFGAVALLSSRRVAPDDGRLPEMIPINLDGSYMRWIGKAADGSQFLISNAFIQEPSASASGGVGRRYFTTFYLFDAEGVLKRSQIDEVGEGSDKATALAALEKVKTIREQHLASLGRVKYGNISVRPFQVQREGRTNLAEPAGKSLCSPAASSPSAPPGTATTAIDLCRTQQW
jgi:hypothetical protein